MDDADLTVKPEERAEVTTRSRRLLAKPSVSHCIEYDDAIVAVRREAVLGVDLQSLSDTFRDKGGL
ncbi:hypothetical protein Sps_01463 [Shewanella psychrophila]|uniref:Uncharacterized protein n=1 Tax=Shewanella psychrophila TaxID=225848 RepID=A0A1S6HMA0_9GAMM|nr:hypothetical protein [Shewanella psychrophila]AQS36629.1 hypothetical protein Sps_01463 [Shewanella psychrophila]